MLNYVIPAYNAEPWLGRCIASLIAGGADPSDIIVVDDGSRDSTSAIATSFSVKLVQQNNAGVAAARNAGVLKVTKPLVCFMDADDYVIGRHFDAISRLYDGRSDAILCRGAEETKTGIWLERVNRFSENSDTRTLINAWISDRCLQTSQVVWSARIVRALGGYRALQPWDDIDFAIRAFKVSAAIQLLHDDTWSVWERHQGLAHVSLSRDRSATYARNCVTFSTFLFDEFGDDPDFRAALGERFVREACSLWSFGYRGEARTLVKLARLCGARQIKHREPDRAVSSALGIEPTLALRDLLWDRWRHPRSRRPTARIA